MEKNCFDHAELNRALRKLQGDPALQILTLGKSILGQELPVLSLGTGKRAVLYVGGIRGTEGETTRLLLDFAADYLHQLARNATVFEYSMRYMFEERRIYLLPMLNPDGISYATSGVGKENPIYERLLRMNGHADFSAWQANARGVDLGHNFDVGFYQSKQLEQEQGITDGAPFGYSGEYPESEPETAALCRFLRMQREEIVGVMAFHLGAGEIFCDCDDRLTAKTVSAGRVLSRFTGYRMARPESLSSIGSLSDWCISALARPAFTVKCDSTIPSRLLYERLRRVLFSYPYIV